MNLHLTRRQILAGTTATAASLAAGWPASPAAAAVPGFPTFTYAGTPLNLGSLSYNPTGEIIFPSLREVGGRVQNPLGNWYMYYAPHDAPGGICLAYANSLADGFTEYPGNPIIPRNWPGHYSVSHVSSPHAYWNPADNHIYLYFHGENTTTRVARSADGRNFEYIGKVMTTAQLPSNVTETSYARVHPHPQQNGIYIMLFLGNQAGTRKIFIGWSHSLTSGWKAKPEALISPQAGENGQLAGAHYWSRNGGGHVVYHSASGNIHVAYVGTSFDFEDHLGVLHSPMSGPPDNNRCASPSFAVEGNQIYMFYTSGPRGATTIARAVAPA